MFDRNKLLCRWSDKYVMKMNLSYITSIRFLKCLLNYYIQYFLPNFANKNIFVTYIKKNQIISLNIYYQICATTGSTILYNSIVRFITFLSDCLASPTMCCSCYVVRSGERQVFIRCEQTWSEKKTLITAIKEDLVFA